jgi:hypothetical protein
MAFEPLSRGETMRNTVRVTALSAAAALVACSTTKVTSDWKNPTAKTANIDRVLVVALVPDEKARQNLEQRLVAELNKKGAQASPSAQFIQTGSAITKENVTQIVEQNQFDSLLIVQYAGSERELQYVPRTYDEYFTYIRPGVYRDRGYGYTQEITKVQLQSRLFDVKNGGVMLWSATTSTVDTASMEREIPKAAGKIVDEMGKNVSI